MPASLSDSASLLSTSHCALIFLTLSAMSGSLIFAMKINEIASSLEVADHYRKTQSVSLVSNFGIPHRPR